MDKMNFYTLCKECLYANRLDIYADDHFVEYFYNLTEFMLEFNKKTNLTALRDERSVISRHITDCLLAAKHLPEHGTILDVGSGGGMPALPFAIVRPDLKIVALDATAKKTAYIASAAEHLGLKNVSILTGRAEELGADLKYREEFDVCSARAVAELRVLLEWCVPFIKPNGYFLSLKGKNALAELDHAQNALKQLSCKLEIDEKVTLFEPWEESEENDRHNFFIRKTKATDKKYPRRNAQISKNPL